MTIDSSGHKGTFSDIQTNILQILNLEIYKLLSFVYPQEDARLSKAMRMRRDPPHVPAQHPQSICGATTACYNITENNTQKVALKDTGLGASQGNNITPSKPLAVCVAGGPPVHQ